MTYSANNQLLLAMQDYVDSAKFLVGTFLESDHNEVITADVVEVVQDINSWIDLTIQIDQNTKENTK